MTFVSLGNLNSVAENRYQKGLWTHLSSFIIAFSLSFLFFAMVVFLRNLFSHVCYHELFRIIQVFLGFMVGNIIPNFQRSSHEITEGSSFYGKRWFKLPL